MNELHLHYCMRWHMVRYSMVRTVFSELKNIILFLKLSLVIWREGITEILSFSHESFEIIQNLYELQYYFSYLPKISFFYSIIFNLFISFYFRVWLLKVNRFWVFFFSNLITSIFLMEGRNPLTFIKLTGIFEFIYSITFNIFF